MHSLRQMLPVSALGLRRLRLPALSRTFSVAASPPSSTYSPLASQRNDERISTGSQYIPPLPKPVYAYPSFWVIKQEAEEFLYPLYARGWGVGFYARRHYTARNDRYIAHLHTEYSFANYSCASQFLADLAVTADEEKHHPALHFLQNGRRPFLSIFLHTSSALRPRWHEEDPNADPPLSRRVPGITRRDLRFAILLEHLYDQYYHDGRALEPRGQKLKRYFARPTWEFLVARFIRSSLSMLPATRREEHREHLLQVLAHTGKKGREQLATDPSLPDEIESTECPACGGNHRIHECMVRSQYPPSTLCYICLEPHWWLDCPERHREGSCLR